MMFASDLDRTLIYSNRALAHLHNNQEMNVRPVEFIDHQPITFISEQCLYLLKQLSRELLFVPVTTRSIEQYKRIHIFQQELPVQYAVTTNGANIFYKNQPLHDWNLKLIENLKTEAAAIPELLDTLSPFLKEINGRLKIVEDLFVYLILEQTIELSLKSALFEAVSPLGWKVSLQGRKLYFMPNLISKGNAVQYIAEREGIQPQFGAGDSLFDDDFLQICSHRFVPAHGELVHEIGTKDSKKPMGNDSKSPFYEITNAKGIAAGEEIVSRILQYMNVPQR